MAQFSALTMAALSVGALAAVGGGVSYAAKDAAPGDMLYPVHMSLYGDVSAGTDAEAELNLAQNIFDQASSLKAEGKLDAGVHADLTNKMNLHVQSVHGMIATLEAEGKTDDAAEVRAMLRSKLRDFDALFRLNAQGDSSASADTSAASDASASSEDSMRIEADADANVSADGSVTVEDHDSESIHSDSSNGSVNIDVNADASTTVNVD